MRIVDTTCTKCGANLHIDADRKTAFCEYCGAQLLIDDEVQHLQIDNAESAGYAFEKGRQRAQNEAQAQRHYSAQPQPAPKKNKGVSEHKTRRRLRGIIQRSLSLRLKRIKR